MSTTRQLDTTLRGRTSILARLPFPGPPIHPKSQDDGTTLPGLWNQPLNPSETNLAEPGMNLTLPAPAPLEIHHAL